MATVQFNLHPAQAEVNSDPARFKIVAAGRRFGKTVYAVIRCYEEALASESWGGIPLDSSSEVIYVGTDREQAKRNAWPYFEKFALEIERATGLKCRILQKTSMIELPLELGGCRIRLLGMDDPDAARGMKLRFAVLDEYADMPSRVWPEIIRPALADVRGEGLFIGTPRGRNHFWDLVCLAIERRKQSEEDGKESVWAVFKYQTEDNPFIHREELEGLIEEYTNGSEDLYEQEIKASFIAQSGQLFSRDEFQIVDKMPEEPAETFVAVDLAGFEQDPDRKGQVRKKDDNAIAVVSITENGNWYVRDIQYGRWDVRQTALKIVLAARKYKAYLVGIEKGIAKDAVDPWLTEYKAQVAPHRNMEWVPLTHGNQRKYDRIQWALQGRAQKKQLFLVRGEWNEKLIDQAIAFPDRNVHDDLVDALAYIDQLAPTTLNMSNWGPRMEATRFQPTDIHAGY